MIELEIWAREWPMATRLARIWVPPEIPRENIFVGFDELGYLSRDPRDYFAFQVNFGHDTWFSYHERWERYCLRSVEPTDEPNPIGFFAPMGCLSFDEDWTGIFSADMGSSPDAPKATEKRRQFTARWLPFFRRGCWLSGCDIECTAQERLKWIQGFTSEEIEAWNLKL